MRHRIKKHVSTLLQKAHTILRITYRNRHGLRPELKKTLTNSLGLPVFNHCDTIYGPRLSKVHTRPIKTVQDFCLRLIFGVKRRQIRSHRLLKR